MAKRVTVSIPDMLHEKMEKWRESFNLSKMFQDAVMEAIQKKEDFQKRIREDLDLQDIIGRLRQEKARSEGDSFESGRQDGLLWARSAHYDDLMYAVTWTDYDIAVKDLILGGFFRDRLKDRQLLKANAEGDGESFLIYVKGWKNGIEQFWNEIRDKL
jgi:Arc/MetJ-type ribon-helix-helix transcriptional regulator